MSKNTKQVYTANQLRRFYFDLVLPRKIEERMLKLLRQNKISKWFSGIGQEAIAVGTAHAITDDDFVLPMHRNLGLFTTRKVPLYTLFCQLLGRADGFSKGRERSFHFGTMQHNLVGMISHLGANLPVACGFGMSAQMRNEDRIAVAFLGEGATSEGDVHEAMNLAAVWKLPVIFLIENNGYGLSTPVHEQYACEHLVDRAKGYGMPGYRIDGNNLLEVYETISNAKSESLKDQTPILIEADTFRMRGHEEASGTAYVPDELFEKWAKKDPIHQFRQFLMDESDVTEKELTELEDEAENYFTEDLNRALKAETRVADPQTEEASTLAPAQAEKFPKVSVSQTEPVRFIDALHHALRDEFEADDRYLILGQDIAEYGGVFKVTQGFLEKFGPDRVRNTPIIESAAIGAAMGLALEGWRPIVEMQFADFISCGFNQIINNAAKAHYRWSDPLNITIRAPHGAGVGAGPFHSQSPEGWFMQHPGLKVVTPATVSDAYALTLAAMRDPNPVLIFEHKKLYRGIKEKVSLPEEIEPLGKAKLRKEGTDAAIITFGMGVHKALEYAEELDQQGHSVAVLDLRTLYPLDTEAVLDVVKQTGKVLLLEEAHPVLGPMDYVSSLISDQGFQYLDGPIVKCSSLHTPVPTSAPLEESFLPWERLRTSMEKLLAY